MVEKWIGKIKQGRTSTNDAERSRRPKDVTTPEIIENIHDHHIRWSKSENVWLVKCTNKIPPLDKSQQHNLEILVNFYE